MKNEIRNRQAVAGGSQEVPERSWTHIEMKKRQREELRCAG
jgi:hypothetical protein